MPIYIFPPILPYPMAGPQQEPDVYYFILTVAGIAVMLVVSNILAFTCCSRCRLSRSFDDRRTVTGSQCQDLIPATKYKKDEANATECSVCLSSFAEGEEVRQLPECKHTFHAPCIDMWLHSHSSCPLCRGAVAGLMPPMERCPRAAAAGGGVSRLQRPLFTESANIGHVVVGII